MSGEFFIFRLMMQGRSHRRAEFERFDVFLADVVASPIARGIIRRSLTAGLDASRRRRLAA
jgi:hypothetical protein